MSEKFFAQSGIEPDDGVFVPYIEALSATLMEEAPKDPLDPYDTPRPNPSP